MEGTCPRHHIILVDLAGVPQEQLGTAILRVGAQPFQKQEVHRTMKEKTQELDFQES